MKELDRVQQLIFDFDGLYDIHQAYDLVIPSLAVVNFDQKRKRELAHYVGASWCQIVYYDVTHRLQGGVHIIKKSKDAAKVLLERVKKNVSADGFDSYVVARWYDGAAKLLYRIGDHTQSRFWMSEALDVASQPPSKLTCYFDIFSNQTRNRYEEKRQAGLSDLERAEETNAEIRQCIDDAMVMLPVEVREFAQGSGKVGGFLKVAQATSPAVRELLRGICSLNHNWSTLPTLSRSARLGKSKQSEFIARALQDGYRLCQTLHQQASLQQDENPGLSRTLWQQVISDGRWIRGTLMSRQNILLLDDGLQRSTQSFRDRRKHLVDTFDGLIELADEIQQRRQIKNLEENTQADPILDIDLYGWTIQGAARRLGHLHGFVSSDEPLDDGRTIDQLEARLRREIEQMLKSYRSVIKVATNKHAYATQFKWAYDQLIKSAHARNEIGETLYWVEESTSRDVLDMVSMNANDSELEDRDLAFPATAEDCIGQNKSILGPPSKNEENGTVLGAAAFVRGKQDCENLATQIQASVNDFETHAEEFPVSASPVSIDILDQLNDFTKKSNSVVVRIMGVQELKTKKMASALVSIKGETHRIDDIALDGSLQALANTLEQDNPSKLRTVAGLLAQEIGKNILEKLFCGRMEQVLASSLVCFVPTADTLRIPLHLGLIREQPLCFSTGTVYCGSLTALLTRGRLRGCWLEKQEQATLGSIVSRHLDGNHSVFLGDEAISDERLAAKFSKAFFTGHEDFQSKIPRLGGSSVSNIKQLINEDPTFLTIGAHGGYWAMENKNVVHPYLDLGDGQILTPYHLATFERMENNRFVALAACLAAQGSDLEGGEVGGFYRALAAIGSPAITLPFIPVIDNDAREFVSRLLGSMVGQRERVFLPGVMTQLFQKVVGSRTLEGKVVFSAFGLFV